MTDKQLAKIKKPSKLIRIALADLTKVERSKKYEVNMDIYHSGQWGETKCAVCFAGAVMAKSLGTATETTVGPTSFKSKRQLRALDDLRLGDVTDALGSLGRIKSETAERKYRHLNRTIVDYHLDPNKFKRQMRALARDLEGANL